MVPQDQDDLPDESEEDPSYASEIEWEEIPDAVRHRLAELGAEAISGLNRVDIPQQLRAVAKFAPAKRARLGGASIMAALRTSPAFRTAGVEWAREHRPAALEISGAEPVSAAAAAILLGDET